VFEHHREHHDDAVRAAALADWQVRHDAYAALVDTARTFTGTAADGLLLAPWETLFLQVADTELIEERRGRGTYVGHSQGISVPVARVGGRQIRYRVGASKGHFVQGEPSPTAIDSGTTYITSTRVVFRGGSQTRECAFARLLGFDHDPDTGSTTLSVSNRKTATTIHYGPSCAATVEFRLDLALAHFRGTVDELVDGLEADLAAIDAERPGAGSPAPPAPAPPPPASGPPPVVPPADAGSTTSTPSTPSDPPVGTPPVPVAAGWYPDPWGAAPLRWWDGAAWSWPTADPSAPPVPPA
jgi:hypothetical protein